MHSTVARRPGFPSGLSVFSHRLSADTVRRQAPSGIQARSDPVPPRAVVPWHPVSYNETGQSKTLRGAVSVRTKSPRQAEKILEAAARLFGTQRFHEVRMEDIAAEAEVGKGTLYRYFNDKEELYVALLGRSTDRFCHRLDEVAAGGQGPGQRLEALVAAVIGQFDDEPHLLDLILRAEALHKDGDAFPWRKSREEVPRLLKELFAEGEAEGLWAIRDVELTTVMLMGAMRAVIRFGEKPRPSGLARRIVDNFLQGASALRR
jgi:AcrR family transcriptional regulator